MASAEYTAGAKARAIASAEYTAGAKACLAWLAWQDRRPDDVMTLAGEIAELWAVTVGVGSRHGWIYLCPLAAAHLDAGQVAEAIAASRQLPDRAQQKLPDDLEAAVAAASRAWDQGQPVLAGDHLAAALALAHDLRYF